MKPGIPQAPVQTFGQGVAHYENFPVASVLCPRQFRPAIAAIYWFARTADDLADEGHALPAERLQDLAAYRADLQACAQARAGSRRWQPVFDRLQPIIEKWQLPLALLTDLLSAFEQDVVKQRYADQAELLDYCRRSANPVGRLLLHLYKVGDEAALIQSDCICTALQMLNFWQDLSLDLPRGRLYLPADRAAQHGVSAQQLLDLQDTPAARALIAESVGWARGLMLRGAPLVKKIPGRAGWELRLVVQGGVRIAEKIAGLDFATLTHRPKLGTLDVVLMSWRALRM